jgi:hypothetical protein
LRREVPSRSVAQIIQFLEWEGKALPGEIRRSTLQERLSGRGYSSRQMRMYDEIRRCCPAVSKAAAQSTVAIGYQVRTIPPIGPNHTLKQVFLVSFIDDATRFILHAAFYPTLESIIVEDCFRMAIQKWACRKLHISIMESSIDEMMTRHALNWVFACSMPLPMPHAAKGKVEKFNRLVDTFLKEVE